MGWARVVCAAIVMVFHSAAALAADWSKYGNARYNYWIDVPPGFSKVNESDNGDGGTSASPDGRAELLVWGGYLLDRSFAAESKWRADQDRADGWNVSYQKQQPKWAVWSGSKDGRIFYERAILVCGGDAAAYFRLEYDESQAKAFDPIVARLTKSLRSGKC
jgi:hypothetical protein